MIYLVTKVDTGEILDTVTWDKGKEPQFDTGRSRELIEGWLKAPGGSVLTALKLKSWSNGYISTQQTVR